MANHAAATYFRPGDRAVDQLRSVRFTPDFIPTAEGSVLIELGHTRVLCNATVENGVPGWLRNRGQGWITAEYGMLPRATLTRTARESERGKVGGRTHEIQRLIGRSLRAAVDLKVLGERTIILDCDVLQADGGTRTAAITGAAVALGLAINRLVAAKVLPSSPIRHLIAATSVGVVEGTPLLDLAYEEDARADVDMNVVMTEAGEFIEVQATAEHNTFSRQQHFALLDMAAAGIQQLIAQQQQVLASSR
ncbi:MAG: ribonuclease PH [Bryocella sp.]